MSDTTYDDRSLNGLTLLIVLLASLATFVLWLTPMAGVITYPLRLFATFIHETAHVLAALLTGGSVDFMEVYWNASGVTHVRGGSIFATASAGYLGTALFGAAAVLSARTTRSARALLGGTGAVVLLVTALYAGQMSTWPAFAAGAVAVAAAFGAVLVLDKRMLRNGLLLLAGLSLAGATVYLTMTGSVLTWLLGMGAGLALLGAGMFTGGDVSKFLAAFLGVQVGLDALSDVAYLVKLSAIPCAHTDAKIMAQHFALPPLVWALLWSGLALVMVFGALGYLWWDYKRNEARQNPHAYLLND